MTERAQGRYREWAAEHADLPLFLEPWWLDAAAGRRGWDGLVAEDKGVVVGAMPFRPARKYGLNFALLPPLCQHAGPWLMAAGPGARPSRQVGRSYAALELLMGDPPGVDVLSLALAPGAPPWVPLSWRGYGETTRYTLQLSLAGSSDETWSGLEPQRRARIRKAREELTVDRAVTADAFWDTLARTFGRQGIPTPYTRSTLRRVIGEIRDRQRGEAMAAVDSAGRIHAVGLVAWDQAAAYYLASGGDPQLRNSGAQVLIAWEAIERAREEVPLFDFEGSMLRGVEEAFRSFGAVPVPYAHVRRLSRRARLLYGVRDLVDLARGRPQRSDW